MPRSLPEMRWKTKPKNILLIKKKNDDESSRYLEMVAK